MAKRTLYQSSIDGLWISKAEADADPERSQAVTVDTTPKKMLRRIHELASAALEGAGEVWEMTPEQMVLYRIAELSA